MNTSPARGRVGHSRNSENPAATTTKPLAVDDLEDLLTTAEVAAVCRTSESTVRYWRHRDVGPHCYKVGRRVLYPRHRLNLWLREQQLQDADRRC